MRRDVRFWRRVAESLKRKLAKDEVKSLRATVWDVKKQLRHSDGRIRQITASGQALAPHRVLRAEAKLAGLAPTGRQWRKVRKQMRREEKALRAGKVAA